MSTMSKITVMLFFLCSISLIKAAVAQYINNAAIGAVAKQALNSIPNSDLNVANIITPSKAGNTVVTLANGNINNFGIGVGAVANPNIVNANVNPKQTNNLAYANNFANAGVGVNNFSQANLGGMKQGVALSNTFGIGNLINVPYGGIGTGDVSVAGDFDVKGATQINGQVPVKGGVQFNGVVPAIGTVTIAAKCGCPSNM